MVERLADQGIDSSIIETRIDRDRDALDAIAEVAEEFATVVLGESDPSLSTFVFGMPSDRVVDRFLGPVLVVQREKPAEAE